MLDEDGNGSDDEDDDLVEESDEESDSVGTLHPWSVPDHSLLSAVIRGRCIADGNHMSNVDFYDKESWVMLRP